MKVEPYPYFVPLQVRFNETDLQGHVNFAWYFNYFDVAVTSYLTSIGYSYRQMRDAGLDLFYVNANASYYAPSYFEEMLRIHCRVGHIGNSSMRFDLQVFSEEGERLVATGEIVAVLGDADSKEKLRVPDHLRQAVASGGTNHSP